MNVRMRVVSRFCLSADGMATPCGAAGGSKKTNGSPKSVTLRAVAFAASAVALLAAPPAHAVTYTWNSTTTGARDWTSTANWAGSTVFVSDAANELMFFSDSTTNIAAMTQTFTNVPATLSMNTLTLNGRGASSGASSTSVTVGTGSTWTIGDGTTSIVNLNANFGATAAAGFNYTVAAGLTLNQADTLFIGNGSGGFTFSGAITQAAAGYGITKNGTSSLTLSNAASSYDGATTINQGTFTVSALANGGANSSIGSSSAAASNLVLGNGVLFRYTGSGHSSNRSFTINGTANGHGVRIDASGTGALNLTATATPAYGTANQTRTLTLNGTNTANNTFAADIADNGSGAVSLTKASAGTWLLSGNNTYTGSTTITGGALVLNSASALPGGIGTAGGTSALVFNGGVVGLGDGDFTRSLDTSGTVTAANFTGAGGWAAFGADRIVNLGGANGTITWATANTGFNGQTVILGSTSSTHTATLTNPIALGTATRTIQVDNGTATTDGVLSGNITGGAGGALTKTGTGLLALSANNTYTGTTTISAGTLQLGTGGTTGSLSTSSTISNSGTLAFNRTDTVTQGTDFASSISGTGGVTQSGSGTLVLSGTNTYSGTTAVSAGTLRLDTNTAIQSSILNTAGAGTVTLNSGNSTQFFGGLSGANNLASVITSGYTGNVTSLILNVASGNTPSYSGIIADGVAGMTLTKNGTGTQTFTGNNTYTGGTIINAGTVALSGTGFLGANGTTITFNGSATLASAVDATLVDLGSRSIALNGSAIATFGTTASRPNITVGGNVTGSGGVTAANGGFWQKYSLAGTGNTFTGAINDSRGGNDGIANALFSFNSIFDGVGAGNITLNGGNDAGLDYGSGAIASLDLNNRQLILANNNTIFFNNASSQAVNINTTLGFSGAGARQLRFGISGRSGSGTSTFNGLIANNGASAFTPTVNGGLWVFTANNTYNGTTTVSAGTLRANDNAGLPGASSSGGGSNLNVAGGIFETGANLERAGGTGQAQMQITGNGTTGFSANGGNVQVAFGTIASPTALTWGTAPFSPGTFVLNGTTANATIEFLNDVALGAATRTVQTSANVATMSGALSGVSGALTKTGAGTLSLAGSAANTYGGLTTIAGGSGTLRLGKSGTAQALANGGLTIGSGNNTAATVQYTGNSTDMMGTGTVTINGRGILDFNGATDTIGNVSIVSTGATTTNPTPIINTAGGGGLTIGTLGITPVAGFTSVINAGNGGTITLGGTVTFTAATTGQAQITGGGLSLGSATRTFNIGGGGTGAGHDLLVDSIISGSAVGLTKTGTGRLILSGNNTYTGLTTVSGGGNLTLSGDNSAMSGGVTLDGATATTRLFIGSATALGNGTFTISGGNNAAFDNSSGGNLTLTTNNAQVWSNDFLFTGTNPLNMGTGNVTMGGTRSLTVGGTLTVGGVISGGAGFGLTKGGGGTLVLSGNASTYTGATTINQGTLSVMSIGNVGAASSLGAPTATANGTIALGSGALGGTLQYIGTGDTTNRVVNLSSTTSNVTIDHSGTGLLQFTSNFTATGAGAKTLILSGSTTGTGRIDGNIVNSSSATTLGKTGTGTWTLNGTNTYTGNTTISGGTLQFARTSALYNSANASWTAANIVVRSGGTIGFNVGGTGEFSTGNITTLLGNLANSTSTTNGMNAGSRFAFDTTNASGGNFTIANVIANSGGASGGARGVTKLGTNTLIFTGNNTYTGSTDVNAGTLRVNGQTAAGSVVTVLAGATLGGNGTVGGATTIFGIHDPGNSPGVQTFGSDLTYSGGNATVNWEIVGNTTTNTGNTTYDQIIVGGNLDFAGATGLNLTFNGTGSAVLWADTFWSSNQTWMLHDVAGTTTNFSNLAINILDWQDSGSNALSVARPGASFAVSQSGQDVLINYIAVPEPGTIALLGSSVVLLGLRLARRKRT